MRTGRAGGPAGGRGGHPQLAVPTPPSPAALQRILELASAAFVAIDYEGRIAGWNLAAERMFGWSRAEAHGRGFRETILTGDDSGDDALLGFLGTGDLDALDRGIELITRHRDGREFPVALTLAPVEPCGPILFSAFLDDISDRREAIDQVERAQLEVVERLVLAADYRDHDTGRHSERVGSMAAELAAELGLQEREVALIRRAAPLHDIGKIAVSDAVLLKPGALTDEERRHIQSHTLVGGRLLDGARFPLLEMAHEIALYHHERWDGTGYPTGRAGQHIPLAARIVAVVDAFDALTHARPYRRAQSVEHALDELRSGCGRQFDPAVVDAFVRVSKRSAWGRAGRFAEARPAPCPKPVETLTLRCFDCGAHAVVRALHHPGGQCGNCRSYRLVPLDEPLVTAGSRMSSGSTPVITSAPSAAESSATARS